MYKLTVMDACLAGVFSFAAIHYAFQWWYSRHERLLAVFAIQCATYSVFSWTALVRHHATTIEDAQTLIDRNLTIGLAAWIVVLQFYAMLANRRDVMFRALVVGVLVVLAVVNQWVPLRGTVIEIRTVVLPMGGTVLLPIRGEPGPLLALLYLTILVIQVYGVVVARIIWKRGDRIGAVLVAAGVVAIEATAVIGVLVDFAGLRSPYVGALPHAIFVLCMALFLAREYSARAKRVSVADRSFETVFERAPFGKALLSPDGKILRVNRALCSMFGATADELCAQGFRDLVDHELDPRLCAGEIQTYSTEKQFLRKTGERASALLAVSAIPDDDGRPARIIADLQDITELRAHRDRLEELVATRTRELSDTKDEAERANAAKSKFLAHISHEIRTPLGVIMLYAQLLQRYSTLDEDQRKKVGIILSSGKHLLTLLSDVLEMSKIEAGRANLVEARFDPWAALDEIERMFSVQSTTQGVSLTIERAADLPRALHGDGGKVNQILINLVSNAVKFTRQGSIRVKASASPRGVGEVLVEIVVADTGIGIAAPDSGRMFQPFQQLDPGVQAGGTGLGLAISRTHARLMRGDITFESTPDAGTTFTFTFVAKSVNPVVRPSRLPSPPVTTVPAQTKVLIVDDVQHNRDILEELLAKPSFETRTAVDGPGALAVHADWSPDLVLIDLRMPAMDGLEAIRRMRAAGSRAVIGVITASVLPDDEPDALATGADFFMRKPYDERELFKQIARVLGTRDIRNAERPPT